MQEHLRDYVWMALPGSAPEKVPAVMEQISRKMAAGYSQVFSRDEMPSVYQTPVVMETPVVEETPILEEDQQ
jgi:hypothetical protein